MQLQWITLEKYFQNNYLLWKLITSIYFSKMLLFYFNLFSLNLILVFPFLSFTFFASAFAWFVHLSFPSKVLMVVLDVWLSCFHWKTKPNFISSSLWLNLMWMKYIFFILISCVLVKHLFILMVTLWSLIKTIDCFVSQLLSQLNLLFTCLMFPWVEPEFTNITSISAHIAVNS